MKIIKQNAGKFILYFFELLLGILLLADPVKFTEGIIMIIGIALLLAGAFAFTRYFHLDPIQAMVGSDLAKGLLFISAGLFCIIKTEWFIMTFPVLPVLYGIASLIVGFVKVQGAVDLLRMRLQGWGFRAVNAVLTLVLAVVVLMNPFATMIILWRVMAVSLIVIAALDVIALILSAKNRTSDVEVI